MLPKSERWLKIHDASGHTQWPYWRAWLLLILSREARANGQGGPQINIPDISAIIVLVNEGGNFTLSLSYNQKCSNGTLCWKLLSNVIFSIIIHLWKLSKHLKKKKNHSLQGWCTLEIGSNLEVFMHDVMQIFFFWWFAVFLLFAKLFEVLNRFSSPISCSKCCIIALFIL